MRRSPIVLAATVAGTAGVLAFHPHRATVVRASTSRGSSAVASSPGARSATGDAVPTPYGDAEVRVTVRSGRIVEIQALELQGNDPRSVQIWSSAEPVLRQEALTAQSARIDSVSGATFTSASYDHSLQSALDKLGFEAADGSRATLQLP
jgi:uncharacterized protein with FMN-binding domain